MTVPFTIEDGGGTSFKAAVSEIGELSVISGEESFTNVLSSVPPGLSHLRLTREQIANIDTGYLLGRNTTVDNVELQDLTNFGEDYITTPRVSTVMEISSSSAEDNPAGTGAKQVTIHGLDVNFNVKDVDVVLNGLTPVLVDSLGNDIEFLRINHMSVSGVTPNNAQHTAIGILTLEDVGGLGLTYAQIEADGNMELAARGTVPAGFTAYIENWNGSVGDLPNQGDEVLLVLRGTVDPNTRVFLENIFTFQDLMHLDDNSHNNPVKPILEFPEFSEIKVSARLNGGNGTAVVSASFQYWLVPDA